MSCCVKHANDAANAQSLQFMPHLVRDNDVTGQKEGLGRHVSKLIFYEQSTRGQTMSTLLPFHKKILEKIHDPSTSDLIVLARGLGLRRIICTLLKIYDSPQNLVLLINATPEEETAIGEELGIMGCRKPGLRVVGYEIGSRDRYVLKLHMSPFFDAHQIGEDRICIDRAGSYLLHLEFWLSTC